MNFRLYLYKVFYKKYSKKVELCRKLSIIKGIYLREGIKDEVYQDFKI